MGLVDLLKGTIGSMGGYNGKDYASDMADPILSDNGGKSVVFVPGAYCDEPT